MKQIKKIGCRTLREPIDFMVGEKIPLGTQRFTSKGVKRDGIKIIHVDGNTTTLKNGIKSILKDGTLIIKGDQYGKRLPG